MTSGLRGLSLALAVIGAPLVPTAARGQSSPLVLEVRAGSSIPVASFSGGSGVGEGASAAASFGVDFAASGSGRRTLYLGFSQQRFGCADAGCPTHGRYVATSLDAGFRFSLLTRGAVNPWLRVGGLTMLVESPALSGGTPSGVSSRGYGGEVGLGVYIGAWSAVALNPGIRFSTAGVTLPGGDDLRLRYVVADLGLALAF